jgi:hypothetical protein
MAQYPEQPGAYFVVDNVRYSFAELEEQEPAVTTPKRGEEYYDVEENPYEF